MGQFEMHPNIRSYNLLHLLMRFYLTGFMGSGKTFLGSLWAEDNGLSFYDLDTLIEEEERMPVSKIFSTYGESYFREKEAAVLRNTDRFENCIVACGGGTPCFFDNMQWMNKTGTTVYLKELPENIYHHLVNDKKSRPLIIHETPETLQSYISDKLTERSPIYEESKVILVPEYLNRNGFNFVLTQM